MIPTNFGLSFEQAAVREGIVSRHRSVAGHNLRLDIVGPSIFSSIVPAFLPLRDMAVSPASGHLRIWADADYLYPTHNGGSSVIRLPQGGILAFHSPQLAAEALMNDGRMVLWGTPETFANGDIVAHPASIAMAAWLAQRGTVTLHVAAVGTKAGAALLVGRGGGGKSTTALACAAAGMKILGDDICAVTTDGRPEVHSLYGTAKVTRDSEEHLALVAESPWARTSKDKRVLALNEDSLMASAPITAIIVLTKSRGRSRPLPLSRNEVMRAMAPTALPAAIGSYPLAQWLRCVAVLTRDVPGFLINIDWDLKGVVGSVTDALAIASLRSQ